MVLEIDGVDMLPYIAHGGVQWQREIEEKAYNVSGSYRAPAQKVGDFLKGQPSTGAGEVQPTYRPGVTLCDLHDVLPARITDVLEQAIQAILSE